MEPFISVPVSLADDQELTVREIAVFVIIAKHANYRTRETFVGQDTIASRLSVSVDTVQRAIKRLAERGHIVIHRKWVPKEGAPNGGTTRNIYEVPERNRTPAASVKKLKKVDRSRTDAVSVPKAENRTPVKRSRTSAVTVKRLKKVAAPKPQTETADRSRTHAALTRSTSNQKTSGTKKILVVPKKKVVSQRDSLSERRPLMRKVGNAMSEEVMRILSKRARPLRFGEVLEHGNWDNTQTQKVKKALDHLTKTRQVNFDGKCWKAEN